ncbi:MAG: hypothetical protein K1X72_27785 [Pyrinomonadaceae bacterium]|nr:hypothetical protein [Pyrinomonadaceae bacterium]
MIRKNPPKLLSKLKPDLLEQFIKLQRQNIASYSIISLDPPIFYVARYLSEISNFTDSFKILFDFLKPRKAYFLFAHDSPFSIEAAKSVAKLEDEHRRIYENFEFIHLCNYETQIELFESLGLKTIFCNHNAMVDENIFKPLPFVKKEFDAVYDARLQPFKRHYLAAQVKSIGLIYYSVPTKDEADYFKEIKETFQHAVFFNHLENGIYHTLTAEKVNDCLNKCCVGLCLSDGDGAQYSSIQYLLAGLPVVETESFGGRDVFFDKEFTVRVLPNKEAVAKGVQEMIARNTSPADIRQKTLEKMQLHRQNFISLIQNIYEIEGIKRNFAAEWNKIFFNRLVRNQHHVDTIELLKRFD